MNEPLLIEPASKGRRCPLCGDDVWSFARHFTNRIPGYDRFWTWLGK